MILSAQDSSLSGHLVNIISYDLAVKMEKQLREQRFRAVIAVSCITSLICYFVVRSFV